ncbi:PopZ family protein [Govanella unica]|uniref:DUF2497 domain-containing protein n=1 Tax=Govanella unica TaxID=2975056 RepID=A0A9X3TWY6_9PROT|nr:DUF2497 domain-containing protein [Govania unica]MDA5193286.1 DUF2497 domain-containing protein [Govania unica]
MSAKREQDEPTMEEILASIRRIISEENEPESASPPRAEFAAPPRAAASEPVQVYDRDDEVLELTEVFEEEPEPEPELEPEPEEDVFREEPAEAVVSDVAEEISLDDDFEDDFAEPVPAPEPVIRPEPRPVAAMAAEDFDAVDPTDESEAILSDFSADSVRASFGQLSDLLVAGYAGADKTLEGMVREMLKPLLKSWLDQNLPDIVERTVAREIARLARVKKP